MALQQTKILRKNIKKESILKTDLAKKLKISVDKINEYILGDDKPSIPLKIIPSSNGYVEVEYTEEIEVPKYEGVFFNQLKNGDKSFYVIYKDIITNKNITVKIGNQSKGITEKYCFNKRNELVQNMRVGETPTKVKNKRLVKEIITFDMVALKYFENRKLHLSTTNHNDLVSKYNIHVQPFIGNLDIEEIETSHIENIIINKKEEIAPSTINKMIEGISTIFNFAIKKRLYTGKNPTKDIKKLKDSNERTRFLSQDEIDLLINEAKQNEVVYLFTILSLTTGGRLKTICNIKIKDIDFDSMIIELQDFKNKSFYRGFIKDDPYFMDILKKHTLKKEANDFLLGRKTLIANVRYIEREMPKIFNKLFNQNIEKDLENLTSSELAEIRREKVVIHTLRHTFASQLVINGTPIFTVKSLMNHKDINHTMRYAKLSPDSGRNFVDDIF